MKKLLFIVLSKSSNQAKIKNYKIENRKLPNMSELINLARDAEISNIHIISPKTLSKIEASKFQYVSGGAWHDVGLATVNNIWYHVSIEWENQATDIWDININGLINVLEVGRAYNVDKIIWPSSIAAFGPTTPRENTPNITVLQPTTMYGITKVAR